MSVSIFRHELRVFWKAGSPGFPAVFVSRGSGFARAVALLLSAFYQGGLRSASPAAFTPLHFYSFTPLLLHFPYFPGAAWRAAVLSARHVCVAGCAPSGSALSALYGWVFFQPCCVTVTPWGNTALQGRTQFGDYKSYIRLAHPIWVDMGFIYLALHMQHKYFRQLHIKLENSAGKNF